MCQSYAENKKHIYNYMTKHKEKYNEISRIKQQRYYNTYKEYFTACRTMRKISVDYFLV